MEQWKIEYFREVYLGKDTSYHDFKVVEEIIDWLEKSPDTFEQPMAQTYKKGWDAAIRYDESILDNQKGEYQEMLNNMESKES